MTLASRIGVMHAGEIVQVGSPTDIYEYPTSKFVADFIGSVNLFDGRLVEDEPDHVRIHCPELGEGVIYVDHGISAAPTAAVSVALRPEKIRLSRDGGPGENRLRGTVAEIAYVGEVSRYLVKLATGSVIRVSQPNLERHAERIGWDEQVWLSWDPSAPVVLTE